VRQMVFAEINWALEVQPFADRQLDAHAFVDEKRKLCGYICGGGRRIFLADP